MFGFERNLVQIETLPEMQTCSHKFWTNIIKKTHLLDPKPSLFLTFFGNWEMNFPQNKLATCSNSVEIWKMFPKQMEKKFQHTTTHSSIPAGQCRFLDVANKLPSIQARWWFQICFIFTPIWGRFPFGRSYFSDGLKPPTSRPFREKSYIEQPWNQNLRYCVDPLDFLGLAILRRIPCCGRRQWPSWIRLHEKTWWVNEPYYHH